MQSINEIKLEIDSAKNNSSNSQILKVKTERIIMNIKSLILKIPLVKPFYRKCKTALAMVKNNSSSRARLKELEERVSKLESR